MIRTGLIACGLLTVLVGVVFALRPDIDLNVARSLYVGDNRFVGVTDAGEWARRVGYVTPFALIVGAIGLWLTHRYRGWPKRAPGGRTILFLALSFAFAPGLMANLILKDNWHRPRPVQVAEFGGQMQFRPWWRTDGDCKRNCSFVSGEGSSAFWTLAPAIAAPPAAVPYAVVGALAFGTAVSALRMAFGGHFLSDTLFAALFTALIVLGLHRVMFSPRREPKPKDNQAGSRINNPTSPHGEEPP